MAMDTSKNQPDVVLVGAGIMSATLAVLLSELSGIPGDSGCDYVLFRCKPGRVSRVLRVAPTHTASVELGGPN